MPISSPQLRLEIDRQYQNFLTHFADLELLERTLRDVTTSQHRSLLENRKRLVDAGLEDVSSSHHNMSFRSLSSGEHIFYHAGRVRQKRSGLTCTSTKTSSTSGFWQKDMKHSKTSLSLRTLQAESCMSLYGALQKFKS